VVTRRRRTRSARNNHLAARARLVAVTWLASCCPRWKSTRRYVFTTDVHCLLF